MKPNPQTTPEADGARQDVPYFDDEATVLARPVVPLEEVAGESAPAAADGAPGDQKAHPQPALSPEAHADAAPAVAPVAPLNAFDLSGSGPGTATAHALRRTGGGVLKSVPLALVLLAVLAGVVIGGAGFYLFQQRLRPEPAAPAGQTNEQSAAEQPAATSAPEQAEPQPAPVAPQETAASEPADEQPAAEIAEKEPDTTARAAEPRPAAARRDEPETRAANTRDSSASRSGRDDDADRPRTRREESARTPQEAEARRVDAIVYQRQQRRAERREQRRAERRERRSVDSVRSIFEGQP